MNDPTDFLVIKLFGLEASASGQYAIAAVVLIAIAVLVARGRR
ncbi:hypothetical protein [Roseibium sp. M-1]